MSRFFAVENSYQLVSIHGYDWTAGQAENRSSEDGNQRMERRWNRTELVRPVVSIERGSLDPPGPLSGRPATLNHLSRHSLARRRKASGAERSLNTQLSLACLLASEPRKFTRSTAKTGSVVMNKIDFAIGIGGEN